MSSSSLLRRRHWRATLVALAEGWVDEFLTGGPGQRTCWIQGWICPAPTSRVVNMNG